MLVLLGGSAEREVHVEDEGGGGEGGGAETERPLACELAAVVLYKNMHVSG